MVGEVSVNVAAVAGFTVTEIAPVVELAELLESVALMDRGYVPAAVGVPVREQPLSMSPGTDPLTSEQLYGAAPPETPIAPV